MRVLFVAMLVVGVGLAADVRVAKPLPAFSIKDLIGQSLTSSNYAGKTLMIWFFASWDKPCRKQLPVLVELAREYATNGVVLLGVSLDMKGPEAVKAFAATNQLNFSIAMADLEFIQGAGGLEAVPTTLIVEPHGNVIGRHVGVTSRAVLEADIKAILNQGGE